MSGDSTDTATRDIPVMPQAPQPDNRAREEELAISGNQYQEDGKKRDHGRQQKLKDVAYIGVYALVAVGVLFVIGLGSVWTFHLIAPTSWRWLAKDEVEHLQTLLFSGGLSAALTLMGKKLF